MAFSQDMLETMVAWCRDSLELAQERREARTRFFGDDDPTPIKHGPGAEEVSSQERRYLGYFMFHWRLASGETPSELCAKRLYQGSTQAEVLAAVLGARFVFAVVQNVSGRDISLAVEDEQFRLRHARWAATLRRHDAVAAYLVPVRHGLSLLGPGWVNLPFTLGPGARSNLSEMQVDPIAIERMLQGRSAAPDEPERSAPPVDQTLETAVARMTAWATEHGHPNLVMPITEWEALVLKHLTNLESIAFHRELFPRARDFSSEEEVQELVGLASNIWNNTPQPDRGGRTANQMIGLADEPNR
ncbi:MAG: hypothetical protein GEU73_06720 [Chloroflexi bacterium]|nr:hypothetical protein [Chloroflexota bacterium]